MSSNLSDMEKFLAARDDRSFTETADRRCRGYGGMGLQKPDKVALTSVAAFKPGDNVNKWMEAVWHCILLHSGGYNLARKHATGRRGIASANPSTSERRNRQVRGE